MSRNFDLRAATDRLGEAKVNTQHELIKNE